MYIPKYYYVLSYCTRSVIVFGILMFVYYSIGVFFFYFFFFITSLHGYKHNIPPYNGYNTVIIKKKYRRAKNDNRRVCTHKYYLIAQLFDHNIILLFIRLSFIARNCVCCILCCIRVDTLKNIGI